MERQELLPFQTEGAWFLAGRKRALLADQQRVGKTPQAIRACDILGADRILVLCPAIARVNWLREFQRFSDRDGNAIATRKDAVDYRLTVCSYDNLIDPDVYQRLSINWDVVVMDEAHFCVNLATQRSQAAYGIANGAHYAYALSATPAPGHSGQLWALLSRFGRTRLSYWEFMRRYVNYRETKFGITVLGNRNLAELRQLMDGFMLRRLLSEVAPDMPPIRWSVVTVEPGDLSAFCDKEQISAAMTQRPQLEEALKIAREDIEALGEVAKDYRRLLGLQKVQPLVEMVSAELSDDLPNIVIFAWHRDVIEALALGLQEFGARVIHGGTADKAKQQHQDDFRAGRCRVLCCQIITAGTAIDLSVCDDLLFAEMDYTPGNNSQAALRCVSQFKRRPVRVRCANVDGSVDERITEINVRKTRNLTEVFG